MRRKFEGIWIPEWLWFTKELSIIEKLFYVEIQSLDNEDGCYASNAHFSEMFDKTVGRCTQIIKSLEGKGWVTIELQRVGKVKTRRICRAVDKSPKEVFNKLNRGIEKIKQGYLENDHRSNTKPNNTKNINPKTPTASAVGLVPPSAIYKLAKLYLEFGEQQRFVKAMVADLRNDEELVVVADALQSLAAKDAFEALKADDAIAYSKAAVYKGRKTQKDVFKKDGGK